MKVGVVECDQQKPLCNKFDLPGYPTVLIFTGKASTEYEGERTVEDLVETAAKAKRALLGEESEEIVTTEMVDNEEEEDFDTTELNEVSDEEVTDEITEEYEDTKTEDPSDDYEEDVSSESNEEAAPEMENSDDTRGLDIDSRDKRVDSDESEVNGSSRAKDNISTFVLCSFIVAITLLFK